MGWRAQCVLAPKFFSLGDLMKAYHHSNNLLHSSCSIKNCAITKRNFLSPIYFYCPSIFYTLVIKKHAPSSGWRSHCQILIHELLRSFSLQLILNNAELICFSSKRLLKVALEFLQCVNENDIFTFFQSWAVLVDTWRHW